ncbi:MAG: hypothetical protein HOO96_42290 [Polyangiaceae bacterium]|nr:hypothetical protein [Polyangiaceae bacterium]
MLEGTANQIVHTLVAGYAPNALPAPTCPAGSGPGENPGGRLCCFHNGTTQTSKSINATVQWGGVGAFDTVCIRGRCSLGIPPGGLITWFSTDLMEISRAFFDVPWWADSRTCSVTVTKGQKLGGNIDVDLQIMCRHSNASFCTNYEYFSASGSFSGPDPHP